MIQERDWNNVNKQLRKRTKGEKELQLTNRFSFLSPPVLPKKEGGHKIRNKICKKQYICLSAERINADRMKLVLIKKNIK